MRSITAVKLTRSLARLSAATAPRASSRNRRGKAWAAAVPTAAPSALAPQSPSMDRAARSLGRLPSSADCRCCAETDQPGAEQDDRFGRSAGPQVEQIGEVGRPRDECCVEQPVQSTAYGRAARPRALHQAAAAPALRPTPRTLIVPLVTSPELSARRCPRKPLAWVVRRGRRTPRPPQIRHWRRPRPGFADRTVKQPVHPAPTAVRRLRSGPLRG